MASSQALKEWHCSSCGRLLAKIKSAPGMIVEVKCWGHKCNTVNSITA